MQRYNYLINKMPMIASLGILFIMSSCGSYQYAGYEDDGIYSTSQNRQVEYQAERQQQVQRTDKDVETSSNTYYKNYFAEKSNELDAVLSEDEIFTDIDSYEGSYAEENDSLQFNPSGFAGWGQANDQVVVNVYNNGWNNWGWGGLGWGWGWNRWNRFGVWNAGWGWGGFYDPFWGGPWGWNAGLGWGGWGWNAGWGWNRPFWNNGYWHNGYYGSRRGLAYNTGRRGSLINRSLGNTISRRNSNSFSRRSSTSSRRSNYNTSRRRSSSNSSYNTNRSRPRINSSSNRRSSTPNVNSRSSRRSSGFSRPSSSSRRSSGVSRSSSSRSSGRSSGGSRGGRRN